MKTTVTIANMRCNKCKNTVTKKLNELIGITKIKFNLKDSSISFNYNTHNSMEGLRNELSKIGFPITKDPNRIIEHEKVDITV